MSLLKVNEVQNYNGSSLTLTASTVSTSAQLNTGGNISVTGSLNVSDDSTTRTNLGLGSMATQNANAVAITGGTFPTGHIIQFAQSFTETGGGVIGNLTSVGSGSPSTILTATINNVLASSKVFGFFYTGAMVLNSGQQIITNITGGSINTSYNNQSGSGNGRISTTMFFYDDAPNTGTNSYVLTGYSDASGNAAYFCVNGGWAYGWMLFEVAQ